MVNDSPDSKTHGRPFDHEKNKKKNDVQLCSTTQVGPGAHVFLLERANRTANIRTRSVSGNAINEHHCKRPADDLNRDALLAEQPSITAGDAPMWEVDDFVPGYVSQAAEFWEREILAGSPDDNDRDIWVG